MASDNEDRWAKQQALYELDFKNGYAAYMDNVPDQHSESPGWLEGWQAAEDDDLESRGFEIVRRIKTS